MKQGYSWEVSVGVTFASFMSAVTLFFTGILIAQFKTFDDTIKVPLLYLIISTFSFIFSASIYSNAGVEITGDEERKVKKHLIYANNIFEFIGLYPFILATPLVIGAVTQDGFLRLATIAVGLAGIFLYSQSAFSILHKEVRSRSRKALFTMTILALSACLYFSQALTQATGFFGYTQIASGLMLLLALATVLFCRNSDQYS